MHGQVSAVPPLPASPPAAASTAASKNPDATVQPPAWDVTTVKPSKPDQRGSMINFTPDGIKITNVPLETIVRMSFDMEDDHIFGYPSWTKTTMLDIEAKVAPDDAAKLKALSFAQRRQMLVSLLEDRFNFKFHHETRELPVYELIVAKGGIKAQASKPDPPKADPTGPTPDPAPGPGDAPGPAPSRHMLMMRGRGHIESVGTGISSLAHVLSGQLGRTVVDKTGLTGNFDYKLNWTPDDAAIAMTKGGDPAPSDNTLESAGPSLFTALQEQLGLKLEAAKTEADVIVIDQIEPPTAN
jgi:bla regulator protein blaR1